jgi:hypothetical protein
MRVIPISPPVFSLSALFILGDKESDAHISYPFISIHFLPVQPTKGHIFRKSEKMEHRSIPVLHF